MPKSQSTELSDLQLAQKYLSLQPFTKLMGAELTALSDLGCELKIPNRDDLQQQYGFMHGGVICYAADNALTIAGYYAMRKAVVTSELKINYLRPAIGDTLIARAKTIYAGRSQAVCQCDVFIVNGTSEKLCAVAQGTIALLSEPKANAV